MTLQITFRDFPPSESIHAHVEKRAAKLLARVEQVITARVTLAGPHRHHQHGGSYRVAIDVVLPGHELVVSPRDGADGHTDLHAAIDDAFADAERQLRDHLRVRRRDARAHAAE